MKIPKWLVSLNKVNAVCDACGHKENIDLTDLTEDNLSQFLGKTCPLCGHVAPWYIIPSDKKWFSRITVCDVINATLESLNLSYPEVSKEKKEFLDSIKNKL